MNDRQTDTFARKRRNLFTAFFSLLALSLVRPEDPQAEFWQEEKKKKKKMNINPNDDYFDIQSIENVSSVYVIQY